jgi:DNA-binding transcriptional ArsR family regulator
VRIIQGVQLHAARGSLAQALAPSHSHRVELRADLTDPRVQNDKTQRQDLTRKGLLTYSESMVVTGDREPDVFGAISHPARRRMLDLLVEADRSVKTIAGHFQMSRPAVSQHLRILLDAGLVTEQRHGRERRYCLVPARLGPVRDWIAHYERFWDERLQRLQKYLTKGNKK